MIEFSATAPAAGAGVAGVGFGGVALDPLRPLSVCVFAGARHGRDEAVVTAAGELGALLGRRGHRLVYGGGGSGLMGVVSWAAHRAGAPVTGVMPKFLYEIERAVAAPPQTLVLTTTMAERKTEMLELADVFVALPGGLGTLDEVFEVLSLTYLDQHAKPMVLVDAEGAWSELDRLLRELGRRGFADISRCAMHVAGGSAEAIDMIEAMAPPLTAR